MPGHTKPLSDGARRALFLALALSITIFFAASYLVRPMAVSCTAWWPPPSAMRILPAGESHSLLRSALASCSWLGFLPPLAAIAFSTASFSPSSDCTMRYGACTGYTL